MKKNKMMRVASALVVAVLLSCCVISGTFAKYVTTDVDEDSARVAKWGVTVDVVVKDAFASEYAAIEDVTDEQGTAIAETVVASTKGVKVLAPGTNGTLLAKAEIAGTPEVAVNVTKVAELTLTGWEAKGAYYCPLTITVDGTPFYGMDYTSAAEFEAAVEGALNSNTNYAPNKDLAEDHSVAWEWAFEGTDGKQTNELDTALGNAAVDGEITIAFKLTVTVTQLN